MSSPSYDLGCQYALKTAGLLDDVRNQVSNAYDKVRGREPWYQRYAPLAAGLGLGAGAYALSRRPQLAEDAALRALQQASKGRLTLVEGHGPGYPGSRLGEWLHKQLIKVFRGADDVVLHSMTPEEEARLAQLAQQIRQTGRVPANLKPLTTHEGAVFNMNTPPLSLYHRGDVDVGGDIQRILDLDYDKLRESQLFARHAPEAMPLTHGSLADVMQRHALPKPKSLRQMLDDLRRTHPQGFVIKDRYSAWGGKPVLDTHRLEDLSETQLNLLHQAAHDPSSVIVQRRIPIEREYRVHTLNGRVVPGAVFPRHKGVETAPLLRRRDIAELKPQIERHLAALPPEYRNRTVMGIDAARTPTGQWKIIETNMGGETGFLSPDVYGFATTGPHHMYEAITGRSSPAMAATQALGAGVLGAGAVTGGQAAYKKLTD